jgi:putative transposase
MSFDPEVHQRKSIRIKGYDYTQPGAYFTTICTYQRACALGSIHNREIKLNDFGHVVQKEWFRTAELRQNVHLFLDEFVVMPNHIHGIIWIVGAQRRCAPTQEQFGQPVAGSLPTIIRSYKSAVTYKINKISGKRRTPFWQRNYYEHIIRTDQELAAIREYIKNNPMKWDLDRENPKNHKM